MGQPTHVFVDTLQHPAVELTQAEGAAVDSSDVSDTSSASSSSSSSLDLVSEYFTDDWMIIVTGIIGGSFGCVLLLAIVSVTMRRCYQIRNSNRNHNHNRTQDPNNLNNSDSASEKDCFSDPTITSDHMILMSNGEMESSENIIGSTNYNKEQDITHRSHQHLHQCIQQQDSFDHPNQGVPGLQHVTVGAKPSSGSGNCYQSSSTMRKGILKHHHSGVLLSGKSDNSCIQQCKPDVTIAGNGRGQGAISTMPALPPKVKHTILTSLTSSTNGPGCQEHSNEFGKHFIPGLVE